MRNNIVENVKTILESNLRGRENDEELTILYFGYYYSNTAYDFLLSGIPNRIPQIRRYVQKKFPELRGTNWKDRQKYSNKIKQALRSQEKPEDKKKWWKIW